MEKIYMGDNNSPQKQVSSKYRVSIILSFVVAVFAIVALITVGFNQVSYAAPDGTNGAAATVVPVPYGIKVGSQTKSLWVRSLNASGHSFNYEIMYEDKGSFAGAAEGSIIDDINNVNILFCYDNQSDEAGYNSTYTDNGVINDAGLVYILNRSGITGNGVTTGISGLAAGTDGYRYLESYATQIAIWLYLNRNGVEGGIENPTVAPISSFDFVTAPSKYDLYTSNDTNYPKILLNGSMYNSISKVVSEARNITGAGTGVTSTNINIIVSDPDHVSKVDGTNYYQSSSISVSAPDLVKFSLEVSGVEGAFVVDKNGEEIKNLNDLPASTEFFIRFPEDKINEKADFVIKATGEVRNVAVPHKYILDGKQSIIKVEKDTGPAAGQETWTVVAPPDTGASTSQTIYFIGLIVLLCGVGIIYANSKAAKA